MFLITILDHKDIRSVNSQCHVDSLACTEPSLPSSAQHTRTHQAKLTLSCPAYKNMSSQAYLPSIQEHVKLTLSRPHVWPPFLIIHVAVDYWHLPLKELYILDKNMALTIPSLTIIIKANFGTRDAWTPIIGKLTCRI